MSSLSSVHFSAVQLSFAAIFNYAYFLNKSCEETESHLKATTKNLNYFILKEAFSKGEKNKQKLAGLVGFEPGTFLIEDEIHTAAQRTCREMNKYFE